MYCPNCVKSIPDKSSVCPRCGCALSAGEKNVWLPALPSKKKSRVPLVITLVLLVLLIGGGTAYVLIFGLPFGGNTPEQVVLEYYEALYNRDGETAAACCPDELFDYFETEYYINIDSDISEINNSELDSRYGKQNDWSIEISVKSVKDRKERVFKDLKEACKDKMGLEITDLKYVVLDKKTKVKHYGGTYEETERETLPVIKSNGKWYVFTCFHFGVDYIDLVTNE